MKKFTGVHQGTTVRAPLLDPVEELCGIPATPTENWPDKAADAYLRGRTFSTNGDSAYGALRFEGCDPIIVSTRDEGGLHYTVDWLGFDDFPSAFLAAYAFGQGMDGNSVMGFVSFVRAMVQTHKEN